MKRTVYSSVLSLLCLFTAQNAMAGDRPVIVELYTSHGCSSCPAADKIVREFSQSDPDLLPLSFHVTYWDNMGWKDPYAMEASTVRQRNYAQLSGRRNVFTPQVVVDGLHSAVGNDHEDVNKAIRLAKTAMHTIPISITTTKYDMLINIAKMEDGPTSMSSGATVWLVYYNKYAMTPVNGGENSGKTIENINNVIDIKRLGFWHNDAMTYHIPRNQLVGDGMAVILQSSPQNQVLGAAMYERPKS
jgi:hypothetical protein